MERRDWTYDNKPGRSYRTIGFHITSVGRTCLSLSLLYNYDGKLLFLSILFSNGSISAAIAETVTLSEEYKDFEIVFSVENAGH